MNKKKVSVVMAGAMLASSVAPVLAAENTVVNESERGLLIKRLRELMSSKVFSDIKANDEHKEDTTAKHVDNAGESVYYVKVGKEIFWLGKTAEMEKAIQDAPAGTKVEVWDRGHIEKDGLVYNHALEDTLIPETYSASELEFIAKDFAKAEGDRSGVYSDVIYKMNIKTVFLMLQ